MDDFRSTSSDETTETVATNGAARSIRARIGAWDKTVSRRVYNNYYHHNRFLLLVLEFSGHGVLWVIVPSLLFVLLPSLAPSSSGLLFNYVGVAVLDLFVISIVKPAVGRQRPEHNGGMTAVTVHAIDQYSFPSGHATRAGLNATFMTYVDIVTPESISSFLSSSFFLFIVYVWAAAVAVSRVALGRHHVLDVIAGLFLGIAYVLVWHVFWVSDAAADAVRLAIRAKIPGL